MSARNVPLTQDEIDELRASFQTFDLDGSGTISGQELATILTQISPRNQLTPAQIRNVVEQFDLNGDNMIDFNEFIQMMVSVQRNTRDELHDVFCFFDKDGSGSISANEVLSVMRSLGERVTLEECQLMIKSVDIDNNGTIDFDEFIKMMKNGFDIHIKLQSEP